MRKRFRLGDTDYDFDPAELYNLTIGEARVIKAHTGLTLSDWHRGLAMSYRGDPDVLAGIVWVVRRRTGDPVDWAEIDLISTTTLLGSVTDLDEPTEESTTADEAAPEGPAKRDGKKRTRRSTAEDAAHADAS